MSSRPQELAGPLTAAVTPVVEAAGLTLETLTLAAHGRRHVVKVVVDLPDGPGGVSSDAIGDVSREVSRVLDEVDLVPGTYTLEVSSPGVDRPLTTPRHFRRAQGRLVRIALTSGDDVTGRVRGADDAGVELDVEGTTRTVSYADVRRAQVEVELKRANENEA